jgi:hypothetical protein
VKKWAMNQTEIFQKGSTNVQKTHEEMLNISGHKGNANQNHINIPRHSC